MEVDAPRVGIIMGSASDKPTMERPARSCNERGIRFEVRVMSAHRDPEAVADYAKNAHMRGLRVIIAGAGMSAALPGRRRRAHRPAGDRRADQRQEQGRRRARRAAVGRRRCRPACPVACVAINGARNAAVLAARIIGC